MPSSLRRILGAAVRLAVDTALRPAPRARSGGTAGDRGARSEARTAPGGGYPGDFRGVVEAVYAPHPDGDPDPGEIVWTWVPYEEDHTRGKDRPVLLVGHDGPWLLGLMLTSRDHDARPSADGRWVDLGSGAWDSRGRPSEVRLDRVLRLDPAAVRREGAVLDRERFEAVAGSLSGGRGW